MFRHFTRNQLFKFHSFVSNISDLNVKYLLLRSLGFNCVLSITKGTKTLHSCCLFVFVKKKKTVKWKFRVKKKLKITNRKNVGSGKHEEPKKKALARRNCFWILMRMMLTMIPSERKHTIIIGFIYKAHQATTKFRESKAIRWRKKEPADSMGHYPV